MGGHQTLDRISRRHLGELLPASTSFPRIRQILHFEGTNGPDGIKRKSPSKDEPWTFFNPLHGNTAPFMALLSNHFEQLVIELKNKNSEKAAFEAAWLAHILVDGLTPAHHYPYEEEMAQLRGGAHKDSRTTVAEKLLFIGDTKRETIKNTIKAWGPRGLYMAHGLFELGVGAIIKPLRFPDARPNAAEIALAHELGYADYYLRKARYVAGLGIFDAYIKDGWTSKLSRQVREELAPTILRTQTVMWYLAAEQAGLVKPARKRKK